MKRLALFRHAKSSWADPSLPDRERPLSGRGERDAPAMAARLREHGERPERILTSHAVRATMTARAVATGLGSPADAVVTDRRLYLASPEVILKVISEQDDGLEALMVIGHNPGLTELANRLLPTLELDNLQTAGIVAIDCELERWSVLQPAACRLRYYDYPKSPHQR